jgi:phosphatidylinositol glycan class S
LEPLLRELSPLVGYTIKSQWLYFVTLNVQPKLVTDSLGHQHYALAEDILPQIITPLEKKLGMLVCLY